MRARRGNAILKIGLSLIACSSSLSVFTDGASAESGTPKPVEADLASVVIIGPPDSPVGTGFVVSQDGYLLTAAHVIDKVSQQNGPFLSVNFKDTPVPQVARIVAVNKSLDLALLRTYWKDLPSPIHLSMQNDIPSTIWILGNEVAVGNVERFKALRKQTTDVNQNNEIETEGSVPSGFSGGPAVDESGDAVGIVLRNDVVGRSYILRVSDLSYFLGGLRSNNETVGSRNEKANAPEVKAVAVVAGEPRFQNSGLRAVDWTAGVSADSQSASFSVTVESTAKSDLKLALKSKPPYFSARLVDDHGTVCMADNFSGLNSLFSYKSDDELSTISPSSVSTLVFGFWCKSNPTGKFVSFAADFYGVIDGKRSDFSVGISRVPVSGS